MSSISASSYSGWAIVTTFTQTSGGQIDFKAFLHLILSQTSSSWHDCNIALRFVVGSLRLSIKRLPLLLSMLLDFRQMISYFNEQKQVRACG